MKLPKRSSLNLSNRLSFLHTRSKSTEVTTLPTKPAKSAKPGDLPIYRAKGKKVTAEELRDLRDLIRTRYALDVEIWNLRHVKAFNRQKVHDKMRRADAALAKIERTVLSMDHIEFFEDPADYRKLQDIKVRVLEGGKRHWAVHPPWQELPYGQRSLYN
ncbi:hypothetical protein K469DRAFT_628283 [Zopfia rhizophila CBS 207.26]|uniref:Uncharacterized protein n=1 Tax=Zopfia rhizophila CBS 207.26 TaxID=1314779 RepID=A0A6A6EDV8_9PEZI|nr:hypothetical protein K469DRAFT_628283 [Zopfia rhizophila CBS 207.26]